MESSSSNPTLPNQTTVGHDGIELELDRAWLIFENRLRARTRLRAQVRKQPTAPTFSLQPSIGPNASLSNLPLTSRNAAIVHPKVIVGSKSKGVGFKSNNNSKDDPNAPLQRDKSLGNYIEFDLSKLHNSKGGFLIDQDSSTDGKQKTLEELKKQRERERQRAKEYIEPGISLDRETRPICETCSSPEIVPHPFQRTFGILVCRKCERECPEKYSLLTKTEVKEDYLLTDAELKDEELLPHLLKANPHKATYSNMMLFCRKHVEAFAFSPAKWGSEEALDQEFEKREEEKAKKRGKKFQQGLADLRKRTRNNVWQKRKDEEHQHDWQEVDQRGQTVQRCRECGHEIEVEVF